MGQVPRRENGSEIVRYDFDDYNVYVRRGDLSSFPNYAADSHWHEDLEFISVLDGVMLYNINGEVLTLWPGDVLLVNARRFHYGFSQQGLECHYYVVLMNPLLLCAAPGLEERFVAPCLADSAPPYVLLHGEQPWEREAAACIREVYLCRESPVAPLEIQAQLTRLWLLLYQNALGKASAQRKPRQQDQKLRLLKDMVAYIRTHYPEKVTLEDVARAGTMSKNGCLSLFGRYMHETPINYLIRYRLKMGAQLLAETQSSVTEIAYQVGFSGGSYFTECFHRVYGCKPLEYRRSHRADETEKT